MSDKLGLSPGLAIDWKLINSVVVPFSFFGWTSSFSDLIMAASFFNPFEVDDDERGTQHWSLPVELSWREVAGQGGMGGATRPPLPEEDQV